MPYQPEFLVKKGDQILGPFSMEQLKSMFFSGAITSDVVASTNPQWHLVSQIIQDFPGSLTTDSPDMSLKSLCSSLLSSACDGKISNALELLQQTGEREILHQAIILSQNNQAKAARWLGISRLTMREKLIKYSLHPNTSESNT